MKEFPPKEFMYKVVEERPKQGFTRVTVYFKEDGQIKGFQHLIRPKEFGRYL